MPKTLIVKRNDERIEIHTKDVQTKDVFIVLAGEIIPVDGKVIKGETTVDESLLTGESIPLPKNIGDAVVGGSINLQGSLEVEVKESYQKSTYNIIEDLIRKALDLTFIEVTFIAILLFISSSIQGVLGFGFAVIASPIIIQIEPYLVPQLLSLLGLPLAIRGPC